MIYKTLVIFKTDADFRQSNYQLICSSIGSASWKNLTNKERLTKEFTEEERKIITKIYKTCNRWYLETGIPKEYTISLNEFNVWTKLVNYCVKYFTNYGKNQDTTDNNKAINDTANNNNKFTDEEYEEVYRHLKAKKPLWGGHESPLYADNADDVTCPECSYSFGECDWDIEMLSINKFCPNCGQKINWKG